MTTDAEKRRNKKYYENNKERLKERAKEYGLVYREKNKEKLREKARAYRQTEKGLEVIRRAEKKFRSKPETKLKKELERKIRESTPIGRAKRIIKSMRDRSKAKGFEWSDSWWNPETVANIIEYGVCVQTGIKFDISKNKHPFAPTPDRIDNSKGYTVDNVQWVVCMYNFMKCDFAQEYVDVFINHLKEKQA